MITIGRDIDGTAGSNVGREVCTIPGGCARPTGVLVLIDEGLAVSLVGSEVTGRATPGVAFGEGELGDVVGAHTTGINKQIVGFKGGVTDGIPGAKEGRSVRTIMGDFVGPTGALVALEGGFAVAFVGSIEVFGTAGDAFGEGELGDAVGAHSSGINKHIVGFNIGAGGDKDIDSGSKEGT